MPSHLAGAAWRTSNRAVNHICALCSVQCHGVDSVIDMWWFYARVAYMATRSHVADLSLA